MATTSVPLFNTDPNVQAQAALLQQRQAMAQALMEQGMKPLDTNNRTVGGVGYHISPLEGLAKIFQSYVGQKGVQDATQQQAGLASQAYAALLDKYQPGTDPTYSDQQRQGAETAAMPGPGTDGMGPPDPQKMAAALMGQQPAQGGSNPYNPQGIPANILARHDAGMINDKAFETLTAPYAPTDATKAATQGGFPVAPANQTAFNKSVTDPQVFAMQQAGFSPEQIYRAKLADAIKNGEIERKGGNEFVNGFTGASGIVPRMPENANPVGSVAPNGAIPGGVTPMPGAMPVQQANAQAAATGTSNGTIRDVTTNSGAVIPMRGSDALQAAQPGMTGSFRGNPAEIAQAIAEIKDPQQRANAQAALEEQIRREGNPVQLGQSTAAKVGDTNQMEGMQKRYTDLQNANTQAQTTSSYLRSIKDLAPAAATGRFTDKLQYVNSLLAQVGNERATDATTANNLLDKYSNQIVARLGQGGLGTDSARAILQSAYPNAHMTKEAIQEAADNLIGAQEMTMAKARILSPHGNAKDPGAYQQKEQIFDQNADPRMWQYKAIADPTQRKAFIQRIVKNDPTFLQRAQQLHSIGAL